MTEDLEQKRAFLLEEVGVEEREADLILEDDDLWIAPVGLRRGLEGEEAVGEWVMALFMVEGLADTVPYWGVNRAVEQLLYDARWRAEEALRRAKERAGGDS